MKVVLSSAEREILARLPGPPAIATIQTTNVWIIEWLNHQDQKTGSHLHDWIQARRPGWSAYISCTNKADVLDAIFCATARARQSGLIPLLHLEAHGNEFGLGGPDGHGGTELLSWEELTNPLQQLNFETACNLVVFIAACIGFSGIKAFNRGPYAPAVALVGPVDRILDGDLLKGTKEFYRRYCDDNPKLIDMVECASRDAGVVGFEIEPFAILAFEAMVESLIVSLRPEERKRRTASCKQRMRNLQIFPDSEIERRLSILPVIPRREDLQAEWDRLFMIDIWPENRKRFGVDMMVVRNSVLAGMHSDLLVIP